MKRFTLFVCALACLFACSLTSNGQWQRMTNANFSSAVNCLATTGSNVYAGTNNGVYVSADNGVTWAKSNSGLGNDTTVMALTVIGSNIFAGTWGGGTFTSNNNGGTWTSVNNGSMTSAQFVTGFAVNGSYLFAATGDSGVVMSPDNGSTWTTVDSGLQTFDSSTAVYIISIGIAGTVLYADNYLGGISTSTDSGKSWVASGSASNNTYTFAASGAYMYGASHYQGLSLTQDTGGFWIAFRNGALLDTETWAVTVSGSSVLAGMADTNGVFISNDTGAYFYPFNTGGLTGNNAHIYALASGSSYIFAGTGTSAKKGQLWRRSVSDLNTCVPYLTALPVSNFPDSTSFCSGDSVILTASAGSGYIWNIGNTTQSIVAKSTGVYSCSVMTPCGSISSNPYKVTVKPAPQVSIDVNGSLTFCHGDSVHLTAVTAGNPFKWSTGSNPTAQTITVFVSKIVTLTDTGANGCLGTATVNVVEVSYPRPQVEPQSTTVMADCMATFSVLDSVGTPTFQWQVNIGFGWNNVNGGIYIGDTTDTLKIPDASLALKGYNYRCIVSNGMCPDTTAADTLTILAPFTRTQTDTLCHGDSLTVYGHTHDSTNIYVDTLRAVGGCDSIYLTTNLILSPVVHHAQAITLCSGDSLTIGTNTYKTSGTKIDTLFTNSASCDSVLTTILIFNPTINLSQVIILCHGDSLPVGNKYHDSTATYIDSLHATVSCDSIVKTFLTIRPAIADSQTVSICTGDSLPVGDSLTGGAHYHYSAGTYIDTLTSIHGCDSVLTTFLSITAINDSIVQRSDSLVALQDSGTYKWVNVDSVTLVLAKGQGYVPIVNGTYEVILTVKGCSDTSNSITLTNVGMAVNTLNNFVTLYPNPATNEITLHFSTAYNKRTATVSIINVLGEVSSAPSLIRNGDSMSINLDGLSAGIYFVQVVTDSGRWIGKFVKSAGDY